MEEIFTGQEWAKFLPSSTTSQPVSITQDQAMGLTSSISQSSPNEQPMHKQWNFREATPPHLGMTQSQMNSGSFPNVGITESTFNQRKTSSFSTPPKSELHKGQYGLSDSGSNHLEDMDLSVSTQGSNHSFNKEQVHINSYNQSNTNTGLNVNPSLFSEQTVNQFQATEINQNQPGSVRQVLPTVDLSYFQVGIVTGDSIFI